MTCVTTFMMDFYLLLKHLIKIPIVFLFKSVHLFKFSLDLFSIVIKITDTLRTNFLLKHITIKLPVCSLV